MDGLCKEQYERQTVSDSVTIDRSGSRKRVARIPSNLYAGIYIGQDGDEYRALSLRRSVLKKIVRNLKI